MPNGTGKTTTLGLLRAALSGEGRKGAWTAAEVNDLRKTNATTGRFQLVLLHNADRITITIAFNFDAGTATYSTTTQTGQQEGFRPPREMQRFLNPAFVRFFVFDGELAESLLKPTDTNAERVIEYYFQLDVWSRIKRWCDQYWRDAAVANAQTRQGLNRWRTWMERYEARLHNVKVEQHQLVEELESLRRTQLQLRNETDIAIKAKKAYHTKLTQAEKLLEDADRSVVIEEKRALRESRSPAHLHSEFALAMLNLKSALDHAKLPDSAAREFFEDIANEAECICGRPLNDESRTAVRDRAQRYLGSEDVGLLNQIKGEVSAVLGTDYRSPSLHYSRTLEGLASHVREAAQCRSALDAVKQEALHDDPELERKSEDIQDMARRIGSIQEKLLRFETNEVPDNDRIDQTWSIPTLQKGLARAKKEFSQISDTLDKKDRAETLGGICDRAYAISREKLGDAIRDQTNECIKGLMPNNKLRISGFNKCLLLDGKSGASAGETLGVAYAFLSTLFSRQEFQLPFVVDSPAGPLDHPKRNTVAQLIPNLAGQFIAFVISTERQGFQDVLEKQVPGNIQYITICREQDYPPGGGSSSNPSGVTRTTDGVLVLGREFFESFQVATESPNAV